LQHTDKRVPAILSGTRICGLLAQHCTEAERVVEFTVGEQTGVRGNDRTAKREDQPAVKIEPENVLARFTRRIRHYSRF
jgi:hypothetical protein